MLYDFTKYYDRVLKKLQDFNLLDEYELISAKDTGITVKHKCGEIFSTKEGYFFDKNRKCLKCLIENDTNNEYTVVQKNNDSRCTYTIRHNICGKTFKRTYSEYESKGCKCHHCFREKKHHTWSEFTNKVWSLDPSYSVVSKYVQCDTKIMFYHSKCHKTFMMTPSHFLEGRRCPICKNRDFGKSEKYFYDEIKYFSDNEVSAISEYTGIYNEMSFIHNQCGTIFNRVPSYLLTSLKEKTFRCETCNPISSGEKIIKNILESNNVDFLQQYTFSDCVYINKLRFDFAIFKNNTLQCLIEFDGLQHTEPVWGEKSFEDVKIRDSIKNEYCKINNIKLIRIPHDDIGKVEKILNDHNII